jgi:glycosyltransferase involved in cell wall biosynthesis
MIYDHKTLNSLKTLIVYWGNYGGGVRLTKSLFRLAKEENLKIFFSLSRNSENFYEEYGSSTSTATFQVATPRNKFLTINIFSALYYCLKTLYKIKKNDISQIVILMPHPWDPILEAMAHLSKIRVLRCIHDATPHSGDLIPKWYINTLARTSSANIFFSQSVADKFARLNKESILVNLFDLSSLQEVSRVQNSVLFVGRIQEYKGLGMLAESWKELSGSNLELKVCGDGNGIPQFIMENATIINRWLTDEEVTELIAGSKILVLPYQEASQSGLIPIAESLGTIVVITPLEGLIEQLSDGASHIVALDFTSQAFADAILMANSLPNLVVNNSRAHGLQMLKSMGAF